MLNFTRAAVAPSRRCGAASTAPLQPLENGDGYTHGMSPLVDSV